MELSCSLDYLIRRVLKINSGWIKIPDITIKSLIAFQRLKEVLPSILGGGGGIEGSC